MPIKQLMYCSRFQFSEAELVSTISGLLPKSEANNSRAGITGCLTHGAGWFLQVLEGEPARVRALMDRIAVDPRHAEVKVLLDRQIRGRSFPEWSLISLDLKECRAAFAARGLAVATLLPTSAPPLSMLLSLMDIVDCKRLSA